ncbi:MAG: hypothetical protein N3A58_06930 [Spirochaetes bacterium]|nr:hypothetical protein [Spirochaetota bacterium]
MLKLKNKKILITIQIITFFIIDFFLCFILFSSFLYAQEATSILNYFTEQQLIAFILYSDAEDILSIAKMYGLDISKDIKSLRLDLFKVFNLEIESIFIEEKYLLIIKKADYLFTENHEKENITIVKLLGNIYIYFENKVISADKLTFDLKNQQLIAEGNVVFIDDKSIYYASRVFFNLKTLTGFFYNVRGKLDNIWIIGEVVNKLVGKTFSGENLKISTCNNINMHYYILSSNFFYSENLILSFDNKVYVGSSPIFWLPIFINFDFGIGYPGEFGFVYQKREGFTFYNTYIVENDLSFFLDIYEKLGIFSGFYYNTNNIKVLFGIAYSQYLFYNSEYDLWTPYNNLLNIDKPLRIFRYGGKINLSYPIFNILNINMNIEYYGDPYFSYDFLTRTRKLKFEIGDFARTYYPSIFPSYTSNFEESLNILLNTRFINVSYSGKLGLSSYIKDPLYIYTPGYLKYFKYFFNLYNFNINMNLINFNLSFFYFSTNISGVTSYSEIYNSNEEKISGYKQTSLNIPFNFKLDILKLFNINLTILNSLSLNDSIDFKTNTINSKNSYYNFNLSSNFLINLDFIKLNSSYTTNYIKMFYIEDQNGWKSSIINNSLNINLLYNLIIINISNFINLYDSETKNLFSFNLKRVSNIKYSLIFNPSRLINLSYNGEYSIFYNLFIYNNYLLRINLYNFNFYNLKVNISNTVGFYQNLIDKLDTKFTNLFVLNVNFQDKFNMNVSINSSNEKFYTYNNLIDLMIDLFRSFNFFNINDRIISYFKLNYISIGIKRDFHDFFGYLNLSGNYFYDSLKNSYYFKFVISFGIQSISFTDLSFEDIIEKIY